MKAEKNQGKEMLQMLALKKRSQRMSNVVMRRSHKEKKSNN